MRLLRVVRRSVGIGMACLCVAAACGYAHAQSEAPAPPVVGTFDGGARQTLESIFVPPLTGAPFSLVLKTEWAKPMFGGGTYTVANSRRIMRDSAGRIYQERWLLAPKDGKIKSEMNWIQIADPTAHTLLNCAVMTKRCSLLRYGGSTTQAYRPATHASGPLPNGEGVLVHEDLGGGDVAGVPVVGTRETTTIAPGVRGNDQPMVSVREFWYSSVLGVNLRSRLEGPALGRETFTASDVVTSEPESRFFAVPEGYTVVDERAEKPVEN